MLQHEVTLCLRSAISVGHVKLVKSLCNAVNQILLSWVQISIGGDIWNSSHLASYPVWNPYQPYQGHVRPCQHQRSWTRSSWVSISWSRGSLPFPILSWRFLQKADTETFAHEPNVVNPDFVGQSLISATYSWQSCLWSSSSSLSSSSRVSPPLPRFFDFAWISWILNDASL